jgi:hypothetical protein
MRPSIWKVTRSGEPYAYRTLLDADSRLSVGVALGRTPPVGAGECELDGAVTPPVAARAAVPGKSAAPQIATARKSALRLVESIYHLSSAPFPGRATRLQDPLQAAL